jgi:hypothetical protein
MLRRLSPRLTYANVLATCALFVALGGTGIAAVTQLANGSVKTPKLANGAVTAPKLANGAVTAPKLANGSVGRGKLAEGAVTVEKIASGAVGVAEIGPGAVGTEELEAGAVGAPQVAVGSLTADRFAVGVLGGISPAKVTVVTGTPITVPPNSPGTTATATCPTGLRAISGGFNVGLFAAVLATGPTTDGTGWTVLAATGSDPAAVSAVVVCVAA